MACEERVYGAAHRGKTGNSAPHPPMRLRRAGGPKAAPACGDGPRRRSSLGQYGLVDPGDIDEVAAQALDFADHGCLAGLKIDRIERTASDEPAVLLSSSVETMLNATGPLTVMPSDPTVLSTPSLGGA